MKSMSESRKKMLVGGFIAFIMVASIFVVTLDYLFSPAQGLTYNGIKFTPSNNQFFAKVNGKEYSFLVYPEDLEYLDFPPKEKKLGKAEGITGRNTPQSKVAQGLLTHHH